MKHALARALLAAVLSLSLTTSAWAGYDEGLAAYERSDYATALEEWLPLANAGDVDAQYSLGNMYFRGLGVPQDYTEAVKRYRAAAEQGAANAHNALGNMYYLGLGVPQDYVEAVRRYRLSIEIEHGYAIAQYNLGVMYNLGLGTPQDNVQAYMWLSVAKSYGFDDASKRRDMAAKEMTPADISEAQLLAREWLEEHGE